MMIRTDTSINSAHRLVGYEGCCHNVHGHNWRFVVELEGEELDGIGILVDFRLVKNTIKELDHKTLLWNCFENEKLIKVLEEIDKDSVVKLPFNPTAENLATYIRDKIFEEIGNSWKYKIEVFETPNNSVVLTGGSKYGKNDRILYDKP